jgi:hypothetical protein
VIRDEAAVAILFINVDDKQRHVSSVLCTFHGWVNVPDDGKIIAFAETCMYEEEKPTENVLASD